jgi:hypothetical protein
LKSIRNSARSDRRTLADIPVLTNGSENVPPVPGFPLIALQSQRVVALLFDGLLDDGALEAA